MDKLEYLNQISQSNRPVTPTEPSAASKITNSLILKILIGGLVAFAILIGVGVLIKNGNTQASDLAKELYVRITNVNKTISDYNKNLKSSQLRSINYSLSGTLTGTSAQLKTYLEETYSKDGNPLSPPSSIAAQEEHINTVVNENLAKAKLNGLLDRTYTSQILLQVTLIMSMTSELLARNPSPALTEILESFYSNLNVIKQSLDTYSNPSD